MGEVRLELEVKNRRRIEATNRINSRGEKQNQLPKRKGELVDRSSKEFQQMEQTERVDQLGQDGTRRETEQETV